MSLFSLYAVCLRIQSNLRNQNQFTISPERAFADFIFANIMLYLVVMNFIGWTIWLYIGTVFTGLVYTCMIISETVTYFQDFVLLVKSIWYMFRKKKRLSWCGVQIYIEHILSYGEEGVGTKAEVYIYVHGEDAKTECRLIHILTWPVN